MAIPIIRLRPVEESEKAAFNKHVCPPEFEGGPIDPVGGDGTPVVHIREGDKTPNSPGVTVIRDLRRKLLVDFDLKPPGGDKVKMWIIADPDDEKGGEVFPSKRIRVTEDEVIHAEVSASGNTHTIHWHGIEPSPMNDGVGKHSFEISGEFTYQWLARCAGTYFYHCHKNTVLHFIRGLFGFLLIDPRKPDGADGPDPPYPDGGPGFVRRRNDVIRYDAEQWWVAGEIDTRWTKLGHNAFMQDCDPDDPVNPKNFTQDGFLNDFCPDIFFVSGVSGKGVAKVDRQSCKLPRNPASLDFHKVAVHAKKGDVVLLRILNTGYTVKQYRIGTKDDQSKLDMEVIAMDGRPLGYEGCDSQYSEPFKVDAGEPFALPAGPLASARRVELLIRPKKVGSFPADIEYYDWRTTYQDLQPDRDFLYATVHTTIEVE